MAGLDVEIALFMLRMYTALCSWTESTWTMAQTLYSAVKEAFSDQLYLFFGDKAHAYPSNRVVLSATSSARPYWLYNATEGSFHEWCGSLLTTQIKGDRKRSLPYLSLELVEGDRVAYDLTDFIEKLCVYTEGDTQEELYPTIEQVISAWSTGSHIVVDESRHYIRWMDTSANTHERDFHEVVDEDEDVAPPVWPPSSVRPPEEGINPVALGSEDGQDAPVPPACGSTA